MPCLPVIMVTQSNFRFMKVSHFFPFVFITVTDSSEIGKRKQFYDPYNDYADLWWISTSRAWKISKSLSILCDKVLPPVIISIKNLTSPKLSTLEAADNDEHNLRETFLFQFLSTGLRSVVTILLHEEIHKICENIVTVRSAEVVNHDSFVCCIISHEAEGRKIFTNDSLTVYCCKTDGLWNSTGEIKDVLHSGLYNMRSGRDEGVSVPAGGKQVIPVFTISKRADVFIGFATPPDTWQQQRQKFSLHWDTLPNLLWKCKVHASGRYVHHKVAEKGMLLQIGARSSTHSLQKCLLFS